MSHTSAEIQMTDEQRGLCALAEYLAQPAFFVCEGRILFSNHLARELRVYPETQLSDLLGAGQCAPSQTLPAQLSLRLPLGSVSATAVPLSGGWLYLLTPPARTAIEPQSLIAISQSIRGPLTSLFTVASAFFPKIESMEDPEAQSSVGSMSRAHYQLLHLACNLTEMRRLMTGELVMHREKDDVARIVARLCETAEPMIEAAGYSFEVLCPTQPLPIWVDRDHFERAVWNLLSNAMKFTRRGGCITLSLEQTPSAVLLRVRDTGEGMTPELLATAFTAYNRDFLSGDARRGAGYGLPYTRRVAELHGGSLTLESAPNEGTCATLTLSLAQPSIQELQLRSPLYQFDYSGGYPHALVELSASLPRDEFTFSGHN